MTEGLLGEYEGAPRHTAPLIYADTASRRCWFWLPCRLGELGKNTYLSIKTGPTATNSLAVGELQPNATDGRLTSVVLEEHQFVLLRDAENFGSLVVLPEQCPIGYETETAHDFVQAAVKPDEHIRALAWFTSLLPSESLEKTLSDLTFAEIYKAYRRTTSGVQREAKLFDELIYAIEERRLVFLLGGVKSGVSQFLEQFKGNLAKQSTTGTHITADFNEIIFQRILSCVQSQPDEEGGERPPSVRLEELNCEPEITSLFMTLAYAAYLEMSASRSTDTSSLESFVPPGADQEEIRFVLTYVNQMLLAGAGPISQVEVFLRFIGHLMQAAGRSDRLTVILSFSRLADWLRLRRPNEKASTIERSLWNALSVFTRSNYNSQGRPLPGSLMSRFSHKIGIIVEVQRLPLAELAEGFCKRAVLTMPPYSDSELAALWGLRFRNAPAADVVRHLREYTGGAPWFVDLLLECAKTVESADPVQRVTNAVVIASTIIEGNTKFPNESPLSALSEVWQYYLQDLEKRLPGPAKIDGATVMSLNESVIRAIPNKPASHLPEWLELGLVWLRHQDKPHTLRAFENYPMIMTFKRGALVDEVIGRVAPHLRPVEAI